MVNFSCKGCGKKYSVPAEYAGKRVVCKACRVENVIPGADGKEICYVSLECSSCGKGLRARAEHAGKRIKCTGCGEVSVIPSGKAETASTNTSAAAEKTVVKQAVSKKVKFKCLMCNAVIEADESQRGESFGCPECQCFVEVPGGDDDAGKDQTEDQQGQDDGYNPDTLAAFNLHRRVGTGKREKKVKEKERSLAADVAVGAGKVPLCLAMSIGLSFGAAGIWAVIVKFLGCNFFGLQVVSVLAVAVGVLAGYGLVKFTEQRSVLLGLVAMVIAFCGIAGGKFMIAKFVVEPNMQNMIDTLDFPEVSRDALGALIYDDKMMYAASVLQLQEDGLILDEHVWPTIADYVDRSWENRNDFLSGDADERWKKLADSIDRSPLDDVKEAETAMGVMTMEAMENAVDAGDAGEMSEMDMSSSMGGGGGSMNLFSSSSADEIDFKAEQIKLLRKHYPKIEAKMQQRILDSKAGLFITMLLAMSFFDFFWIPIGLGGAFRFGADWP